MLVPDWPTPPGVKACFTTRDDDLNVGLNTGEALSVVQANRVELARRLKVAPCWLTQVHGACVVQAQANLSQAPEADAAVSNQPGVACVVMVADCLPVLLASTCGRVVGAAHAGWRGLAAGVLQNTVAAMRAHVPEAQLMAWLGPAIGPTAFEVGAEVRAAMLARLPQADAAFAPTATPGKYWADLYGLARQALAQQGVSEVYGATQCTVSNPQRYYSFRRDKVTGRHAALVWLTN